MKKLLAIAAALMLLGCVQPQAPTPTSSPTASVPTTISAATFTPTPSAALPSNFSNEIVALGEATKDLTIVNGEMMGTLKEVSDTRASLRAYSAHLQYLDPEADETAFIQKNVEAISEFLSSNEYYLGAVNTGNAKLSDNFTCTDAPAYNLMTTLMTQSIQHGMTGVEILRTTAKQYHAMADSVGTDVAADLINAFYDGMGSSLNETSGFIKTRCG